MKTSELLFPAEDGRLRGPGDLRKFFQAAEGFLSRRWHGLVPLRLLFWRDMLLVGSCIHLAAGFVVLMLIAQGAALSLAITMHFLLLPYSLFLVMAVWRFPEGTMATRWVSTLWLVLFTLV